MGWGQGGEDRGWRQGMEIEGEDRDGNREWKQGMETGSEDKGWGQGKETGDGEGE